jgi:predicted nucleic acid-binding Zn ribbon protein
VRVVCYVSNTLQMDEALATRKLQAHMEIAQRRVNQALLQLMHMAYLLYCLRLQLLLSEALSVAVAV